MWSALAAATVGLAAIGCGDGDFAPPPPPELVAAERGNTPGLFSGSSAAKRDVIGSPAAGVTGIDVILNTSLAPDELALEAGQARVQAGYDNARIRLPIDGEEAPSASSLGAATPRSQAALVREAIARNHRPLAVIVDPADPADKELGKAIGEARAAKIPVILVSRPLSPGATPEGAASGPAPILVKSQPFAESARRLVAAAIRNAKNAKLKPDAGAIFLINTAGDVLLPDRVAAVRSALEAAGIHAIQELRFNQDSQAAQKVLAERLWADPKPGLVFSFDYSGATGSNMVAGDIALDRPFIQAGYASEDTLLRLASTGEFAAIAFYVPTRLIRKAVSLAVTVAHKQEVPSSVEIPIEVHESPPTSGAPHFQAEMKARAKEGPPGR